MYDFFSDGDGDDFVIDDDDDDDDDLKQYR